MISQDLGIAASLSDGKPEKCIKKIAVFGFKYLHFKTGVFLKEERELKQIVSAMEKFEIKPFSAHLPGGLLPAIGKNIDDAVIRGKAVIDKCALLRVKTVVHHAGTINNLPDDAVVQIVKKMGWEEFDQLNVEVLRELSSYAASYKISLTIENLLPKMAGGYCTTIDDLQGIIKRVGLPGLGICFDSGHANIAGFNSGYFILKAGSILKDLHLHDNFGQLGNNIFLNDLHRPPGIGNINWLEIINALEKVNYKGPIMFEVDSRGDESFDDVLQATVRNWRLLVNSYLTIHHRRM